MEKLLVLSEGKFKEVQLNIEDILGQLQELVDGYIESPYISSVFSNNNICMVLNGEGKMRPMSCSPSIAIVDVNNNIIDICMGTIVFTGLVTNEYGEMDFGGISDRQIKIVKTELKESGMYSDNRGLHKVRILVCK